MTCEAFWWKVEKLLITLIWILVLCIKFLGCWMEIRHYWMCLAKVVLSVEDDFMTTVCVCRYWLFLYKISIGSDTCE